MRQTGAGTQMCDVTDCTSVRDVYRPTGSGPTAVGDIASCEQASQVQCMTPRVGGAGVMSSPSPLPNPRLPGQPCDVTNTCTAGTTCDCQGICHTDVSLDITAVGDDSVAFWACGTKLGVTAGMGVRKTWRYDGPCSDMYFYATNNNWKTGITLAIEDRSTATMYPSKTDGSSLASIVGVNVPNTEFFADPEYDFSAWVNAVSSADHQVRQPWIDMLTEFGSEAWSYKATDQPGSDLVNSWYKVTLPFCT